MVRCGFSTASSNRVVREFQQPARLRLVNLGGAPQSAATYQEQASRFTEIAVRAQVDSDVDQAWAGYVASKILSDRYNGHYLQEAKDVLVIAEFAHEHGGLALLEYLSALQEIGRRRSMLTHRLGLRSISSAL
jgi:hypothetical protein